MNKIEDEIETCNQEEENKKKFLEKRKEAYKNEFLKAKMIK
jgi:hypothetical protein